MSAQAKKENWTYSLIVLTLIVTYVYSVFIIFDNKYERSTAVEVFFLESTMSSTSGFIAPINSWIRNKDAGAYSSSSYERDMKRYGEVYNEGLYYHPIALIAGDLFGSVFSIISACALFFAIRSKENWGGFRTMFYAEIAEETMYYLNVYNITGEFDVGPIDIGVTLLIAFIVGFFGEHARKKHMGKA